MLNVETREERTVAVWHGSTCLIHVAGPGSGLPLAATAMVNASSTKPAGGEYGDVRASIDRVKLNAYLANNLPAVTVPVTIKQFKVRPFATVKDFL
jgi:hypothetical protein